MIYIIESKKRTVKASSGNVQHSVAFTVSVSAVLCADRVGQMTKTYSDIDAVTRLLEEVKFNKVE